MTFLPAQRNFTPRVFLVAMPTCVALPTAHVPPTNFYISPATFKGGGRGGGGVTYYIINTDN